MMLVTIPTTTSSSSSSFSLTHHLRPNPRLPVFTRHFNTINIIATTKSTTRRRRWAVSPSSSENQTVVTEPTTTTSSADDETPPVSYTTSSEVVRNFYGGINRHDLAAVEKLIAHNCVYEDLIFPQPFVGREAILAFFQKFIDSISTDLQFAIDDISNEDTTAVGVTWHLEWKGKPFPFSKGCSFYRLDVVNGNRQIIYGRDSVEPAIKPGETALINIDKEEDLEP